MESPMARAVNQTVAWIVALFLSLIVFGIGLAILLSMKPKLKDDDRSAGDQDLTPSHGSSEDAHGTPDHPADSDVEEARPKIEHEDPHAKGGDDEEKEITPESVKARGDGHSSDVSPEH